MNRSTLIEEQRVNADNVPFLVDKCIRYISINGLQVSL